MVFSKYGQLMNKDFEKKCEISRSMHYGVLKLVEDLGAIKDEAEEFVKRTKVDALAIAIGTSHGAYKFTRKPDGQILAMKRVAEIHKRIPNTHLVMHGSSSVPQDLQDRS